METPQHQTPKDNKDDATREKMEKRVKSLFAEQDPPSYVSIREVDAMKVRISELEAQLASQPVVAAVEAPATIIEADVPVVQQQGSARKMPSSNTNNQPSVVSSVKEQMELGFFRKFFHAPTFDNRSMDRVANLQYKILAGLFIGIPLGLIATLLSWNGTQSVYGLLVLLAELILFSQAAVWLYRGYLNRVSWVLIGTLYAVFIGTLSITEFSFLGLLELALIVAMAGVLLRPVYVVAVSTVAILTLPALPYISSYQIPPNQILFVVVILGLEGLLLTIASNASEQSFMEADRNALALTDANRDLQNLAANLEMYAKERTHDLELATEVGYAVSQKIGGLTDVLSQSVNLIRSRYGLYYTQIYLLDSSGYSLVLHAATGEIGEQLLARGHRLSLSANSLNVRAVSSQRPVLVGDTQQSNIFLANPLLPLTRSELAVPIIAGNKVVGVLDMQSDSPETFNEVNLPAFQVLATQIAIAIQNSALFKETEDARIQVEEQTRRLTFSGWQEFLNALERNETIGYTFDQNDALPLAGTQNTTFDHAFTIPIEVAGAHIGEVQLADEATRTWTSEETEIVQAAMSRVAQHIETLRLLAQAESYRHEAEQVSRRLTSEGWSEYFRTRTEVANGYSYNQDKVQPLNGNGHYKSSVPTLTYPIVVREEPIGAMLVDSQNGAGSYTNDLVTAVVEQLSNHIENLRLLEQAEQRRLELETVATVSSTVSTVLDPDKLLQAVVDMTKERFALYHAHVYLADEKWNSLLLAAGAGEIGREMVAQQHTIPMDAEQSLVARASRERKTIIVNDVSSSPNFLPNPLLPDTRAEMAIPMIVGDTVLGVFDVQSSKSSGFSKEDADIYRTLAAQVAVALQNARLYVEQAATVTQLRELDRLKSAFLANMSHELRTPLNSILGFTDVMLEGIDGELTEYMDNDLRLIQKNGRHLLHLINDVLDMAKIESGRMNLHPETFKVHDLLEEVNSITSPLASEKNLALFIDEDSDRAVEVYADDTRLRQVMINLVNNSIKFTEKGKISLSVKSIDSARVLISVKDTGIGIPPDHLEAVFQEFTQVDTTTTRKAGGTGLGLPISRRLVEMHGGRLWAESTGVDGEGSTFFVELPVEAQIADVIEKQEK